MALPMRCRSSGVALTFPRSMSDSFAREIRASLQTAYPGMPAAALFALMFLAVILRSPKKFLHSEVSPDRLKSSKNCYAGLVTGD